MKPTRPRIGRIRSFTRTAQSAAVRTVRAAGAPAPGARRGHSRRIRLQRPRRSTVLLAVAALGLTAPPTAPLTVALGTAGAPAHAAAGHAACAPAPGDGVPMSEGIPTPPGGVPSTGTLKVLNLMIDFPDAQGEGSARQRFGEFFPQTAQWYAKSSYGALRYEAEAPIEEWLRMPRPFTSYAIDRGADFDAGYRQLVEDITAAADDRVDFSVYDLVNVLVTANAGPSALDSVLSVTFAGLHAPPNADGVALGPISFIYSRQDDGSPTAAQNAYRVLPHENAHGFGLPDLYTPQEGTRAGHWDIMSEDWGANNDFLAWHKRKLGWLRASQVVCVHRSGSSEHTITPLGRRGGTKLVYVPVSERAGYAVEVRTQEGNDAAVCRPGVLVYRVDADVPSGEGPIKVVDGNPHSDGCLRQANVNPELTDATFLPGQKMADGGSGIVIEVMGKDSSGAYRVKITRP